MNAFYLRDSEKVTLLASSDRKDIKSVAISLEYLIRGQAIPGGGTSLTQLSDVWRALLSLEVSRNDGNAATKLLPDYIEKLQDYPVLKLEALLLLEETHRKQGNVAKGLEILDRVQADFPNPQFYIKS